MIVEPATALEELRLLVAGLDEADVIDAYVRMVYSREYVPVDVLGPALWCQVAECFDGDDDALRHVGQVFRARLGIG